MAQTFTFEDGSEATGGSSATLDAVNEILEAIGEPPATTLDTGGTSEVAEAEIFLDRFNKRVQKRGWYVGQEEDVELNFASVSLTVDVTTAFTAGELVTQATSAATGIITAAMGVGAGTMYLCPVSGTFDGTHAVSGGTSAGAATVSAVGAETSGYIQVQDDVLKIEAEGPYEFSDRNGHLFDRYSDNNTLTWSDSVKATLWREITFSQLPDALAGFIIIAAKHAFQRYKKRGGLDEQLLADELARALTAAAQEDGDMSGVNVLETTEARRYRGNRTRPSARSV